jgi:transcriptional regulator GlxA family with amidase domain
VRIAIPLFDRFTALDAVGPYEVLSRLPGAQICFLAVREAGLQHTENRMLALSAQSRLEDMPDPDVVLVPGGFGTRELVSYEPLLEWLREADRQSILTTSVCTGSLLLGAAGLLEGKRATTHWTMLDELAGYGATPVSERVVRQGKLVTCAGVSAGIDMALGLVAQLHSVKLAQVIQLGIEYDPQPPFNCGSPACAEEELVELVRNRPQQPA